MDTDSHRISPAQLRFVRITGLLGEFEHEFEFPQNWSFVILHGPNGVGKTKLLQLIRATIDADPSTISSIPFEAADMSFSDGTTISVARSGQAALPELESDYDLVLAPITARMTRGGRTIDEWRPAPLEPRNLAGFSRQISMEYPFLTRIERGLWRDIRYDRLYDTRALVSRYPGLKRFLREDQSDLGDGGERIRNYLATMRVHLIETQRLLLAEPSDRSNAIDRGLIPRVETFAEDLTKRLSIALAHNSRTSQKLDRSFPRRLLQVQEGDIQVTEETIRRRYEEQSNQRTKLANIGVLDGAEDLPLPTRELQPWERRVLWNYLEDTSEKLRTFDELLGKVELLMEIVNSRFINKELRIDPAVGFQFITRRGTKLRPDQLSSGEQHELVLVYDLLFNAARGSLVLIDEPEISLHVAWQQKFLDDLSRIADLTSVRFVVATHSPQIIHKWWERAVGLDGGVVGP
ncbi:AAA family ATPase [Luteipulveratus halotolerans]|uniref:AAA family ATPase n=1 Tax=Luteipulveratus halotolerans TaxID=1631356 RepID=UPI0012FCF510|nr:AAA family ATPase [Luteipulveratus halotolerans]